MKIYTKKGDKGKTSLFGGKKLFKDDLRIEAYGTVDELNAQIGVVMAFVENKTYYNRLLEVQKDLFVIGAILATDPEKTHLVKSFDEERTKYLEGWIDEMELELPALKSFILPSGSVLIAHCHAARTVCRRAERRVVSLYKDVAGDFDFITYLNRLSDFFFVLARKFCFDKDCNENLWSGE